MPQGSASNMSTCSRRPALHQLFVRPHVEHRTQSMAGCSSVRLPSILGVHFYILFSLESGEGSLALVYFGTSVRPWCPGTNHCSSPQVVLKRNDWCQQLRPCLRRGLICTTYCSSPCVVIVASYPYARIYPCIRHSCIGAIYCSSLLVVIGKSSTFSFLPSHRAW